MKKTLLVSEIRPGDQVREVFAVREKTVGRKKDGAPFLSVRLSDRTGSVAGVMWDGVEKYSAAMAPGGFARVSARAGEYRGEIQLTLEKAEAVPASDLDLSDFLPQSPRDPGEMLDELKSLAATVTDPDLLELLDAFFSDPDFAARFSAAPAAKMLHHAYLGGLLEHTLSVARLADAVARLYPALDRDLLLTGAVLHDIGKIEEFTWGSAIDYSDPGRLLSHIVLGVSLLDEKIAGVDGFPPDRALLLRHLLVSHHGSREFGSPEPGKIVEAVVLNLLDDLDAKATGIRLFLEAQDPESSWSAFHKTLGRHFFLGPKKDGGR